MTCVWQFGTRVRSYALEDEIVCDSEDCLSPFSSLTALEFLHLMERKDILGTFRIVLIYEKVEFILQNRNEWNKIYRGRCSSMEQLYLATINIAPSPIPV